ncbi:MAG TPA: hypothetical protein VMV94_11805 [Phycisphaerae bacterium]|nr:hypothetical protein [Phycisphaerae bacterium]
MALTANRELNRYVDQELRTFPVAASQHIYKGAIVGVNRSTGHVRHLVAGDLFAGIAYEEMDNNGGAGGDKMVRLYTQGDFVLTVNNATQASVGGSVYATSDEVTSVVASQGASYCGMLMAVVATNTGIVRIQPLAAGQVEHVVSVRLDSLTSAATKNAVMITQRAVKVISIDVSFLTVPNAGNLDVGTGPTTPNQLVAAFNLATLTPNTPTSLTLASRDVAKGLHVWAKVGQASSTAGECGMLTVRYVELP